MSLFGKTKQKTFNVNLEPRREMVLACLWFPLFDMDGVKRRSGKLVRTQQEQEPAAGLSLPGIKCCLSLISRSTPRALPHHQGHPQQEKQLSPPSRCCQSLGRKGTLPAVWGVPVTSHTPHGCLSLQTCQPNPLSSHCPPRVLAAANTVYFRGNCTWSREHSSDEPHWHGGQGIQARSQERQNGNQHRTVSEQQLISSMQAVLLMYSNTVPALTLLDWQQNWITLPNLSFNLS